MVFFYFNIDNLRQKSPLLLKTNHIIFSPHNEKLWSIQKHNKDLFHCEIIFIEYICICFSTAIKNKKIVKLWFINLE